MPPQPQPIVVAQQPLLTHWQAYLHTPAVRLGRWLTTAVNQPLLHDYLSGLSQAPNALLHPLPISDPSTSEFDFPGVAAGIAWLQPTDLAAWVRTEHWLRAQLDSPGPMRFLVLEDQINQPLQRVARRFPQLVQTVTPLVSMTQLLADLAAASRAEGEFPWLFNQLSAAITRADTPAVSALASACLQAGPATGQASAEITVWLSVAAYYLGRQQFDEALRQFTAALARSETAFAAGDATAGLLSVQAWLGEAAVWQHRKRARETIAALQLAVTRAPLVGAELLGVEAARQLGAAFHRAGQYRPASAAYEQALQLAEQLPTNQRPRSTLQAIGDAYLPRLSTPSEREVLRARLARLLG